MNWMKAITDSLEYIEMHLMEDIKIEKVAKIAMVSSFYYQRMFQMLTGMGVQEYIRNRRLSLAVSELILTEDKVIDIAFKYGYESSEAFSRAFKKVHGVNPTTIRKKEVRIKSFPKLIIEMSLKGAESMDYKIEKKDSFRFYGMAKKFSTEKGENFKLIPKFWDDVMKDGSYEQMMNKGDQSSCLGVCMPMDPDKETDFDYVIGAFCKEAIEGYEIYQVPTAEWAVFELKGPMLKTLQAAWKRIFSEWFPSTNFKHAHLPELEVYGDGDINAEDYTMEIWIPIEK